MREALRPSKSEARSTFEQACERLECERRPDGSFSMNEVIVSCERESQRPREVSGSIPVVFGFYGKLQTPAAQLAQGGLTYEEIRNCNNRLSFFELLSFCRDFAVIPDLVTKQNLEYIWRVIIAEHNRSTDRAHFRHADFGLGQMRDAGIDLDEFQAALVRIALIAFAETPEVAVNKLVEYLELGDVNKVKRVIRTKGREMQGRMYGRSVGELAHGTSRATVEETRRRLQRVQRGPDHDFTTSQLDKVQRHSKWGKLMNTLDANRLTLAQQVLIANFEPHMTDFLEPYRVASSTRTWVRFDDVGFDMCDLQRGRSYRARLDIINMSRTMLVVTGFNKRGSITTSITATFDPLPFATGLSRIIDLHVTLDLSSTVGLDCAGFIDVEISNAKSRMTAFLLSIPFYISSSACSHPPGCTPPRPPVIDDD